MAAVNIRSVKCMYRMTSINFDITETHNDFLVIRQGSRLKGPAAKVQQFCGSGLRHNGASG